MFLLGACLALGFVYGMGKVSRAVVEFKRDNCIRVKGYAERKMTSDMASWNCSVVIRDPQLQAGHARLKKDAEACREALVALGIAEGELAMGPADVFICNKRTENGQETNEIDYYNLRQDISVRSGDVAKVDRAAKRITDLIAQGIEVRSGSVSFTCSQIEKAKLELIAEATQNGRERAAALAGQSGGKVGPLISANQGVFQIVPVDSTEVSDYGEYDTSTIEKTMKAVVTLEFAVAR